MQYPAKGPRYGEGGTEGSWCSKLPARLIRSRSALRTRPLPEQASRRTTHPDLERARGAREPLTSLLRSAISTSNSTSDVSPLRLHHPASSDESCSCGPPRARHLEKPNDRQLSRDDERPQCETACSKVPRRLQHETACGKTP